MTEKPPEAAYIPSLGSGIKRFFDASPGRGDAGRDLEHEVLEDPLLRSRRILRTIIGEVAPSEEAARPDASAAGVIRRVKNATTALIVERDGQRHLDVAASVRVGHGAMHPFLGGRHDRSLHD